MTDETDNTFDEDVTDNVETSDDDTASEYDYFDPDEDTEEAVEQDAPDDEGEAEPEATDVATEAVAAYAEDTAVVKLSDGTEMPVAELKNGYLRQSDFTRKTQELANERKTVSADAERMQRITTAFVDKLTSLVPNPPPTELIYSDPQKAYQMQQIHERAMAQVKELIDLGDAPKEISAAMQGDQVKKHRAAEFQNLVSMFPQVADPAKRVEFITEARSAAMELGWTAEQLDSVDDSKMIGLAHWAAKGMAAEKAKALAKAKVAAAPPATPRKPGQGARQANGNAEAMRRLTRSGSIHDAVKIDWD